jgi:spermidine synthase
VKKPSSDLSTLSSRAAARKPAQDLPGVALSEHAGVRYLHLGTIWIQGAMRIKKPQQVELDYIQRMLASLLWLPTEALHDGQAVQLGLGAGALTRFTAGALKMATTVVEINPDVVQANALFFALPAAAEVVLGDAADWLKQALPGSVRLLQVDLYDHEAAAPVLDDVDFYAACRNALEPGGVMSVNLFGRNASFDDSIERIAQAFGADQVWSLRPTREGNTVVVAGRDVVVPEREALSLRAAAIEDHWGPLGLPARKWLRMVRPYKATAAT